MRPRRILAPAVLVLALAAVTPDTTYAAWPHHPALNLPVCTTSDDQRSPAIVSDGAGGAYVAWFEARAGGNNDIYAQHILASGIADPAWPVNGLAVCNAASDQVSPAAVADGSGGLLVAWEDYRSGADIYALRVLATGVADPAWPVNGRAVCTATNVQLYPAITSDGAGGAVIAWSDLRTGVDTDVYAQHVLANGTVDAAWPVNGRAICTATAYQNFPLPVPDGAGGAILAWPDTRNGNNDIFAHHVLASGAVDPTWTPNGAAICVQPNDQWGPVITADNSGGAIIAWHDLRTGTDNDIYAHRVRFTGGVDPSWPANGRVVCGATNYQWTPRITSDGGGGAIVCWGDIRGGLNYDVYAQHVLPTGVVDASWPADGRALCTAANNQSETSIVSDGAGGAIVSWADPRDGTGTFDMYAHHVLASGAVDPVWPANGRAISTAAHDQETPISVSDGAGGAIVAWLDQRSGSTPDLYAQRVARFGILGSPEAEITKVSDVPNDQGGRVKVSWNASWVDLEVEPFSGVREVDLYEVWRSVPSAAALAGLRGARVLASFAAAPARDGRTIVVMPFGALVYAWEYLATQTATHYIPAYSYLAATEGDSTGAWNPETVFMVVARNTSASKYWLSLPDSGYSVDNLAPATPAPFAGNYAGGATHLHWDPNSEPDLAHYRLYRGSSPGFVPGPGNLIGSPPDTGFADVGSAGSYYKLSAVDTHGNESGFALLSPASTTDVGDRAAATLALAPPRPNPATASALIPFALPREGRVSLTIYDLGGRRVRQLMDEARPAGDHAAHWDLRSDAGAPVGGGLYFVRLEADGRRLTRRLAIAR